MGKAMTDMIKKIAIDGKKRKQIENKTDKD